jgi:osmotically inducible protein OsmC
MAVRQSEAEWQGSLKEGAGVMRLGSGAFEGPYSFSSRFESGVGTNPEELLGAAYAGCFSMALSAELGRAGVTPTRVHTTAVIHLGVTDAGPTIRQIDLVVEGEVPGLEGGRFQTCAETAKKNCPVSRALASVPSITLEATLI